MYQFPFKRRTQHSKQSELEECPPVFWFDGACPMHQAEPMWLSFPISNCPTIEVHASVVFLIRPSQALVVDERIKTFLTSGEVLRPALETLGSIVILGSKTAPLRQPKVQSPVADVPMS